MGGDAAATTAIDHDRRVVNVRCVIDLKALDDAAREGDERYLTCTFMYLSLHLGLVLVWLDACTCVEQTCWLLCGAGGASRFHIALWDAGKRDLMKSILQATVCVIEHDEREKNDRY